MSLSGGSQVFGGGQALVSARGFYQRRAPSVYGGAGGSGTRISQSVFTFGSGSGSGSLTDYGEISVFNNEKGAMQNLNDRLASYLEKSRQGPRHSRVKSPGLRQPPTAHPPLSMPVTLVGQSSSHSSRSISSSSAMSLSGGSQVFGGGQALVSARGFYQRRAPSVYGGAGGSGTRISQSVFTFGSGSGSGSLTDYGEISVFNNEKGAMQNLNDRLASYLEKVHSLEVANRKLEMQIREFCEQKTTISRDLSSYYVNITDLQTKIARSRLENHAVILQIDNAQLAAEDFKMKFETEMNMRTMVEADVFRLRGVRDSLTLNVSDLEMQIEGLKEDIAYTKTSHQEELNLLRIQQSGTVNVEVDSVSSVDLTSVLEEIREQYEAVVAKNNLEIERWHQQQKSEYCLLLDIKMRLELEIAEYRRLLEGSQYEKKTVIISKTVEEHKPHIERRVKTIVEEIVDGQVVSSTVDTQLEEIQ
ncbi:putative keratin type I cytoskeletal 19-like isoform 2 [Scophthalmus maximus]|uniref:Putative keratin type I cytoskeletal 19-like isoform 2 n=1 Tax=Scophthalmus maximus TaxID=52904 RepID=A0A2U9BR78_SCOMX|nr:putative keratin type I cytoskeletal 19-like isoform 2 [Scophthalmus maximus]